MTKKITNARAVLALAVLVTVVAGVVLIGVVDGLGGSPAVQGVPQGAQPVPPSASPSPASPSRGAPTLPAGAKEATSRGASEFVKHFFAMYNYSYAALDASQLRDLSDADCKYCSAVVADVEESQREGKKYEGGVVSVEVAVAPPEADVTRGLVVNALVSQTAGRALSREGVVLDESSAVPRKRVDALVVWQGTRWIMRGVTVVEAGK